MNLKTKFAAGLAALALAASLTIPTSEANARNRGWGFAAGVLGTAIVAGAIADSYYEPAYAGDYVRCRWVPRYNAYGYHVGNARVCDYY